MLRYWDTDLTESTDNSLFEVSTLRDSASHDQGL